MFSKEIEQLHALAQSLEASGCWGMALVIRSWIAEAVQNETQKEAA